MNENTGQLPDISSNRKARKWTRRELAGRLLWDLLQGPLFAWSPRQVWVWRRVVLRLFGARIGPDVHIYPDVKIAVPWSLVVEAGSAIGEGAIIYSLGKITIGKSVTVSQYAHLCAGSHNYLDPAMPLTKLPIEIGDGAWICAEAFIGPGVRIGSGTIVGARAVVTSNIDAGLIAIGNPATILKKRPHWATMRTTEVC